MFVKLIVISIISVSILFLIGYAIFRNAIDEIFNESLLDMCKSGVCVRFCCYGKFPCDNDNSFNLTDKLEAAELNENYSVLKGKPCEHGYLEDKYPWKFLENGQVDVNETYSWDQYCIIINNNTDIFLRICVIEDEIVDRIKLLYPYLMFFSIPFLIITLLVYVCIRELRNSHGKSLVAYVSTLLVVYTILSIIHLYQNVLLENYNKLCKAFGYILITAIYMCFFWLNIMCFDIWTTFKGKGIRKNNTKFKNYCAYAVGIPSIIVFVILFINENQIISDEYSTKIGISSCTVEDHGHETAKIRQLIYIYAPIIFFVTINTIFYSVTAFEIYRVQKETSIVKSGESNRHTKKEKARFLLYIRLFMIMGISWIIECLSWYFEKSVILHTASIINCLQGLLIFMMFVWQKKVKKLLERRYSTVSNTLSISMTKRRSQATKTDSQINNEEKKSSQTSTSIN